MLSWVRRKGEGKGERGKADGGGKSDGGRADGDGGGKGEGSGKGGGKGGVGGAVASGVGGVVSGLSSTVKEGMSSLGGGGGGKPLVELQVSALLTRVKPELAVLMSPSSLMWQVISLRLLCCRFPAAREPMVALRLLGDVSMVLSTLASCRYAYEYSHGGVSHMAVRASRMAV